jgi:transcriptional regulator with XRE-family HTH domain
VDVDDDARTIGARLRQIRKSRRKSLVVIAGLAGISKSKLSCIERGEIALDSRSEIVALANALRIAPSELTELPVPAPSNGHADSAVDVVRLALMAVGRKRPGGQVEAYAKPLATMIRKWSPRRSATRSRNSSPGFA